MRLKADESRSVPAVREGRMAAFRNGAFECGVPNEDDAFEPDRLFGIAEFDEDIRIGERFPRLGNRDRCHVADEHSGRLDLSQDSRDDVRRPRNAFGVGGELRSLIHFGMKQLDRVGERVAHEIPRDARVQIALPGPEYRCHCGIIAASLAPSSASA